MLGIPVHGAGLGRCKAGPLPLLQAEWPRQGMGAWRLRIARATLTGTLPFVLRHSALVLGPPFASELNLRKRRPILLSGRSLGDDTSSKCPGRATPVRLCTGVKKGDNTAPLDQTVWSARTGHGSDEAFLPRRGHVHMTMLDACGCDHVPSIRARRAEVNGCLRAEKMSFLQ